MKRPNFVLVAIVAAVIVFATVQSRSATLFGKNAQDPQNEPRPRSQEPQDERGLDRDRNTDRDRDIDRDSHQNPQNPTDYQPVRLPEGTVIPIRLADDVNSNHDKAGTMFTGTVDPSVLINDTVVIPRGTEAHIRMVEGKKGGHIKGKAKVRLELVSLIINGQRLGVDSNAPSKKKSAASAKGSAVVKKSERGGGSVLVGDPGAITGPVIAAFSAAKVEVKAGSRIEFTLESPFTFEKPPVNSNSGQP
jgi:Ni/Co efflux regulator RcnB